MMVNILYRISIFLCLVVIITACQASRVNSSASLMFSNGNEVDTTKSLGKAADREKADFLLPVCVLEHAQTAVCRVQVFDGNKLFDVVSEGGNISIHLSNREGAKYVVAFYSADGYVPATIVLTPDMKPSDVNLNKATDPRLGYVSGVLVKTSRSDEITDLVANKTIYINRARARFTATTDDKGRFQLALPAGGYRVHVDDHHQQIDFGKGETFVLPIVVK